MATSNTNEQRQENFRLASSSLMSLVKKLFTGLLTFFLRAINFINRNPNSNETAVSSTTDLAADQVTLVFPSLPEDVILNVLARVPRRYYPTVSCVSKRFRSLMLSPELAKMRSLLSKDHPLFYVCFIDQNCLSRSFHWFTFNTKEKHLSYPYNSVQVLTQQRLYSSTASIGSKIFFVGGSLETKSSRIWIYDSWSGKLRRGPRMKVARLLPGVVGVNGKLYVMGGCRKRQIQVEIFDPKTRTWEVGPLCPNGERLRKYIAIVSEAVAFEGKIYGMNRRKGTQIIYDTEDGRCETFKVPNVANWRRGSVCVINSLIYAYYGNQHGVMWYDSKDKVWREVKGLRTLNSTIYMSVGMVNCNGKLAFLQEDLGDLISKIRERRVWCRLIVLDRVGEDIHGTIEWPNNNLIGTVPYSYEISRCLSVSR